MARRKAPAKPAPKRSAPKRKAAPKRAAPPLPPPPAPARRSPRRKRDFKAEYNRRIAKAKAAGKTRQQARGHKAREHVERARRSAAKYGASPSTMTKLRNAAKDKMLAVYRSIARNPGSVNEATVRRGMRYMHAEDLRSMIQRDDIEIVNMTKSLSPLTPASDSYYDQLAEYFPVSVDDMAGDDHNPGWYHK